MTPEEARERLLDATEACFDRFGIEKTTIDDVANEAGLSRSMVYRHFDGREDLLSGVVARITDRYTVGMADRLATSPSLAEFVVETTVDLVTTARTDPAMAQLFLPGGMDLARASITRSALVKGRTRTFVRQVVGELSPEMLAELRPGLDVDALADHLVFTGLALILGIGPDTDDAAGFRTYLRMFLLPALIHPDHLPPT